MPTDFHTLLRRDHVDIQKELTQLLDPVATVQQFRASLDGVRLGLLAHVEAEDIVLGRFEAFTAIAPLVAQARAAHRAQQGALSALVSARPGTPIWRDRAQHLRELVQHHAAQEEACFLPALRRLAPPAMYDELAGAFATARLRQLVMMQPSAPVCAIDLETSGALLT